MSQTAVLGFRPHTYWTAAVAVAGPLDAPRVLHRRRFEFAERPWRFIYHQAAEGPPEAAAGLIEQARAATVASCAREVEQLADDLAAQGISVTLAATAASTTRLPERLEDILAAHSRIHAAEGVLCREVVARACEKAGLAVRRVVERELPALVGDRLGLPAASITAQLKQMGTSLGPPWSEDYRLATQAAWLCL